MITPKEIEEKISRKLDMISGGSTTSLPLLFDDKMPEKINNLRIGEALIVGRDLIDYWGYDSLSSFHFRNRTVAVEHGNKCSCCFLLAFSV